MNTQRYLTDGPESAAERRLAALGYVIPAAPASVGNFDLGSVDGTTLYLSGQGPVLEGGALATGKVGDDVPLDQAIHHAHRTGLVLIAAMREILGSLGHVVQIRRVFGMVNAVPDFVDHPTVIDGCSNLFREVFGEQGRHARTAVGMGSLPGNITVEIDAIVTISADWNTAR